MHDRTLQSLIDNQPPVDFSTLKTLKIDLSDKKEVEEKALEALIQKLDESIALEAVEFTAGTVTQDKQKAEILKKQPLLQGRLKAIVARNQLLKDLKIDTDRKDFKPWDAVVSTSIPHFYSKTDKIMLAIAYNSDHKAVKQAFKTMGQTGFDHFWEFICKVPPLPKRFILDGNSVYQMKTVEFFKYLNQLQGRTKKAIPFTSVVLNTEIVLDHSQAFYDELLIFLKNNRHIEYLDMGVVKKHNFDPTRFDRFCEQLKKNNITTHVKVPYGTLEGKRLDDIFNAQNKLKNKEAYKAIFNQSAAAYDVIDTTSVAIPEDWWKPLPRQKDKPEEHYVLEQELAVETQVTMQVEQAITVGHEADVALDVLRDFKPSSGILLDAEEIKKHLTDECYHAIVGKTHLEKKGLIDYFTEEACIQISFFTEGFLDGIVYDPNDPTKNNLPQGFGIYKIEEGKQGSGKYVLFYDVMLAAAQKPQGMRQYFSQDKNKRGHIGEGSADYFILEGRTITPTERERLNAAFKGYIESCDISTESARGSFMTLLQAISPQDAKKIESQYKNVLKSLDSSNLRAMREILLKMGAEGILVLLQNFHTLNEAGLYTSFKDCFIDPAVHLIEFNTPEAIEAIQYLLSMTPSQKKWWNAIVEGQVDSVKPNQSHLFFVSKVNAFRHFCNELQTMGIDLNQLPPPGQLLPVKNINVTVNRMLLILKHVFKQNPTRPQRVREQLANFYQMDLGNDHVFYALCEEHGFFMSEMDFQPTRSCDDKQLRYEVSYSDLTTMARPLADKKSLVSEGKKVSGTVLLEIKDDSPRGKELNAELKEKSNVLKIFEFNSIAEAQIFHQQLLKLKPKQFKSFLADCIPRGLHTQDSCKFNLRDALQIARLLSKGEYFLGNDGVNNILNPEALIITLQSLFYDAYYNENGLKLHLSALYNLLIKKVKDIRPLLYCLRFVNFARFPAHKIRGFATSLITDQAIINAISDTFKQLQLLPGGHFLTGTLSPATFTELVEALEKAETSDPETLSQRAQDFLHYKATSIYFFRYLGKTNTPLQMNQLRQIKGQLDKQDEVDYNVKSLLLPLMARALQSPDCPYLDNAKYCKLALSLLEEKSAEEALKALQTFPSEKNHYTLRDLAALIQYQKEEDAKIDWDGIHKIGPLAYKAFVHLGFRHLKKTDTTFNLESDKLLELVELVRLEEKLEGCRDTVFSVIPLLEINFEQAKSLIAAFSKLAEEDPQTLNRLLNALSQINAEQTTKFPSYSIIESLIQLLQQKPNFSLSQIHQWLKKQVPDINFDEVLSGQLYAEDDFRKELNIVRSTTIESVRKVITTRPWWFKVAVKALSFQVDEDRVVDNLRRSIDREVKDVSTSDELLAVIDQMVDEIEKEYTKIASTLFEKMYNPYTRTKEICERKLTAEFESLVLGDSKKLGASLADQIIIALGPINLKIKTDRPTYFENYNRYKSIAASLQAVSHRATQPIFCKALNQVLTQAKTKDDKRNILSLAYTVLSEETFDFDMQTTLFNMALQVQSSSRLTFLSQMKEIRKKSPELIALLLEQYKLVFNASSEKKEDKRPAVLAFNTGFLELINALPLEAPFVAFLNVLLVFNTWEERQRILDALKKTTEPLKKQLILNFIRNLLTRDRQGTTASVDKLVEWIGLVSQQSIEEEKKETSSAGGAYQRFANANCPPLEKFIEQLKAGKTLEYIFAETDATPKGSRDTEAQFAINDEYFKRLDETKFPQKELKSIKATLEKINKLGKDELVKLSRSDLENKLKAATLLFQNETTRKEAIVLVLACLRELMYRTPPHHFFANDMQMFSLLTAFELGRYNLFEIQTGQGKGVFFAMMAAMFHCLGHSAVIQSSDNSLSKRDFDTFVPFFNAIGAKSAYIEKDSAKGTFQRRGINYASTGDFALYWQAAEQRGELLRGPKGDKVTISIGLDEEDDLLVTKSGNDQFITTQKIKGQGDFYWIYKHINRFADLMEGKEMKSYLTDPDYKKEAKADDVELRRLADIYREAAEGARVKLNQAMDNLYQDKRKFKIEDDEVTALEVTTVYHYLKEKAAGSEEKLKQLEEPGFFILLRKLIDSGKNVKKNIYPTLIQGEVGEESKGFLVKKRTLLKGGEAVKERYVEIVHGGRQKKGYRYSNGDHQLLMARLEEDPRLPAERDYPFARDPLCSPVSVWSPDVLIREIQKDPKSMIVGASGSPGSERQIKEKSDHYNLEPVTVPPQKPKILKKLPVGFAKDEKSQFAMAIETIEAHQPESEKKESKPPRGVLILCQDAKKMLALEKTFQEKGWNVKILNAENQEKESELLDAVPFTILISSNSRRGADIKMTQDTEKGPVLLHPNGLLTIDMDVVSKAQQQQGEGRGGRQSVPGTYQQIFDMSSVLKKHRDEFKDYVRKHPKKFKIKSNEMLDEAKLNEIESKLDNERSQEIVDYIQSNIDFRGEFRREREIIYYQLARALELPFRKFKRLFERTNVDETKAARVSVITQALNDLTEMQQNALDYLAAQWKELPLTLAREVTPEDLAAEWTSTRTLNYLHDRIKSYAVGLWRQYLKKLTERWEKLHADLQIEVVPPLPKSIVNFDLLATLLEIRQRHQVGIEKKMAPPDWKSLDSGPSINMDTEIKSIKQSVNDYSTQLSISSDRKTDALSLVQAIAESDSKIVAIDGGSDGKDSKKDSKNYVVLINKINNSYRQSFERDVNYTNSWSAYFYYLFTFRGGSRSTTSRYRDLLSTQKRKLLNQCPLECLEGTIREELEHLAETLRIEAKRSIYRDAALLELKNQINSLSTMISTTLKAPDFNSDQLNVLLTNTIGQLRTVLGHSSYNGKTCGLDGLLNPSLNSLLQKSSQLIRKNDHLTNGEIASKLSKIINEVTFPQLEIKERVVHASFFRSKKITERYIPEGYQPGKTLKFLVESIDDPLHQYYSNSVLQQIYHKLTKEFHAIDIVIDKLQTAGRVIEFAIQFSTVSRGTTAQTDVHRLQIEIDSANQIVNYTSFESHAKEEAQLAHVLKAKA